MYSLTRNQMRLLRYTIAQGANGNTLFCNNETDYEDLQALEELGLVFILNYLFEDDEFINCHWVIGG